jgi:hypothetical protein
VVGELIVAAESNDIGIEVEIPDTDGQNEYQLLQDALWN